MSPALRDYRFGSFRPSLGVSVAFASSSPQSAFVSTPATSSDSEIPSALEINTRL